MHRQRVGAGSHAHKAADHACHFQLDAGSRVLPGALGQAEPAGNTPAVCNKLIVPSSNDKACLSRRQSFLRLVCGKKFL